MSKQLTLSAILSVLAMALFAGTATLDKVLDDKPGQFGAEAF